VVENSGETAGAGSIRPLNLPAPVDVEQDEHQRPVAVVLGRRRLEVTSVEDLWEIDEEWWRTCPVARVYYTVALEDGRHMTIFRDLVDGGWYQQEY